MVSIVDQKGLNSSRNIEYRMIVVFQANTNPRLLIQKFIIPSIPDKEDDPLTPKVLRHIELIDDEANEYGIKVVKMKDRLMAKKYGYRNPPGITYFRKGKPINYDGDIDDEEEILDWLTSPENMEMTESIEKVNRKMFEKIRKTSDYLAVFFCKYIFKALSGSRSFNHPTKRHSS